MTLSFNEIIRAAFECLPVENLEGVYPKAPLQEEVSEEMMTVGVVRPVKVVVEMTVDENLPFSNDVAAKMKMWVDGVEVAGAMAIESGRLFSSRADNLIDAVASKVKEALRLRKEEITENLRKRNKERERIDEVGDPNMLGRDTPKTYASEKFERLTVAKRLAEFKAKQQALSRDRAMQAEMEIQQRNAMRALSQQERAMRQAGLLMGLPAPSSIDYGYQYGQTPAQKPVVPTSSLNKVKAKPVDENTPVRKFDFGKAVKK